MLGAQRYPFDAVPYSSTAKTEAMRHAASQLGLDWMLPNLAVSFANPGRPPVPSEPIIEEKPNLHGLPRRTCRLCGECDVGCNDGAKNTLDYNYLSRGVDAGVEIRTLAEVRDIQPEPGAGYVLGYIHRDPEIAPGGAGSLSNGPSRAGDPRCRDLRVDIHALRNRGVLPRLSPALGTRFSGNGDLLTFLHHSRRNVEGTAVPRPLDPEFGPVITSAIRMPDSLDGDGAVGRGFYVEDGGNPQFLDWLVQSGAPRW